MIEGRIEGVAGDGVVRGWARDDAAPGASRIGLRHEGRLVAEGFADRFRPDLLRAGYGHGHHAFRLRLRRRLPPGRSRLAIIFSGTPHGAALPAEEVTVPEIAAAVLPLDSLLEPAPAWTVADLRPRPQCLGLTAALARRGPARLVDGLFRFALERWPEPEEAALWLRELEAGRESPEGLLLALLALRAREDLPAALVSPFDPRFPFAA